MIDNLKSQLAKELITEFLDNMHKLGIPQEETMSLINEIMKGDDTDDSDRM